MIKRAITERILQLAECFPVVMVCGPRQVGKTTILKEICMKISEDIEYITFDDLQERYQAQDDPKSFLQRHSAPMLVDEFQYAPDILSYIKIDVDLHQKNGKLYPVEIKKNTSPGQKAMKNFSVLEGMEVGAGAIICMTDIPVKLSDNVITIPADWI